MPNCDFDEKYKHINELKDCESLVYKIFKDSKEKGSENYNGISVDDIYRELFFLGEYNEEEREKVEKEFMSTEPRGKILKNHHVHLSYIGNSLELWSIEREKNFLRPYSQKEEFNDTEFAIMIVLSNLEHMKKVKTSGAKVIPGGWMTLYDLANNRDFFSEEEIEQKLKEIGLLKEH